MLAVHWSPVKNICHILRTVIRKSRHGLFCFPLAGDFYADRWWVKMLGHCSGGKRSSFNGPEKLHQLRRSPERMLRLFDFMEITLTTSVSPDRILCVITGDKLSRSLQVRKFASKRESVFDY